MIMHPHTLSYLLLPLAVCFPLADIEESEDTLGGIRAKASRADLAQGHRHNFARGSSWLPRAPQLLALLLIAKELQKPGRGGAAFRFRIERQDDSYEATTGFHPAAGEKAGSPLGTLAEELNGYSRKKGGFSFRFGRR